MEVCNDKSSSPVKSIIKEIKEINRPGSTKETTSDEDFNFNIEADVKTLASELNFIKDTLLQMVANNKLNAEQKQRQGTIGNKTRSSSSTQCGSSGDSVRIKDEQVDSEETSNKMAMSGMTEEEMEELCNENFEMSNDAVVWNDPEALDMMTAVHQQLCQIIADKNNECEKLANKYQVIKRERHLLEIRVEEMKMLQWDLQKRLDETTEEFNKLLGGKELNIKSTFPSNLKPLVNYDAKNGNTVAQKFRNLLIKNSSLVSKLRAAKTEKEISDLKNADRIRKLQEVEASTTLKQRRYVRQVQKLQQIIKEKDKRIHALMSQPPIVYNVKSCQEKKQNNKPPAKKKLSCNLLYVSKASMSGVSTSSAKTNSTATKPNPKKKKLNKLNKLNKQSKPQVKSGKGDAKNINHMGGDCKHSDMDTVSRLSTEFGDLITGLRKNIDLNLRKDKSITDNFEPNFFLKYCLNTKENELNELNNFIDASKGLLVEELLINCNELAGCFRDEQQDDFERIKEETDKE